MAQVVPIKPNDLCLAEHNCAQLDCRVPNETTADDIVDSRFWAFVAHKLTVGSEIRVMPHDFLWRAKLLVTWVDGKSARVQMITWMKFEDVSLPSEEDEEYELILRGPHKWCISRRCDKVFIKENIPTKRDANLYLQNYKQALLGNMSAQNYLKDMANDGNEA